MGVGVVMGWKGLDRLGGVGSCNFDRLAVTISLVCSI